MSQTSLFANGGEASTEAWGKAPDSAREGAGPPGPLVPGAKYLLAALASTGVDTMFILPGGPLVELEVALNEQDAVKRILVADESNLGFFADGHYRSCGRMAAVATTCGPGALKLVNGLACAKRDLCPVFAVTAQAPRATWGRHGSQESSELAIDTVRILEGVTKASLCVERAEQLPLAIRHLTTVAMTGQRGPVHLSLAPEVAREMLALPLPLPGGPQQIVRWVDQQAIERAADVLAGGVRRAILAGSGVLASDASAALLEFAEHYQIPVATTPRALSAFPSSHPLSLRVFGFAGSPLAERVILSDDVDVLIVLGSRLGELSSSGWDPGLARKQIIQVDIAPSEIGRNFPAALPVLGDARAAIVALDLALALRGAVGAPAADAVLRASWPKYLDESALGDAAIPIRPPFVVGVLREVLAPDVLVISDIGCAMAWLLHYLPREIPGTFLANLGFASMGHSIPAAIAAKLATPTRAVVAVVGDAAFQMSHAEIHTATEAGIAPVIVCLQSQGHAMVEIGCRQFGKNVPSVRHRRPVDVAKIAIALGANGIRVEDPMALAPALREALRSDVATVIEVVVDPTDEPPMGARLRILAGGADVRVEKGRGV